MLQDWADTDGLKFSTSKTVCLHICHLRKFHPDRQLFLNGSPIPVVDKVKAQLSQTDRATHYVS